MTDIPPPTVRLTDAAAEDWPKRTWDLPPDLDLAGLKRIAGLETDDQLRAWLGTPAAQAAPQPLLDEIAVQLNAPTSG